MANFRICIIALVAFVGLFSTVHFQMSPQMACLRGCIITLVAFVWLFSTVHFQMFPQTARVSGCIITQVAMIRLFSAVDFHMCHQCGCLRENIALFLHFKVWILHWFKYQRERKGIIALSEHDWCISATGHWFCHIQNQKSESEIAVVLTVKVSYVASTKYKKLETKVQQLPYIFNIP